MDPGDNWIEINNNFCKRFLLYEFGDKFTKIRFQNCLVAIAKYGGPFAITRNTEIYVTKDSEEETRNNIIIYQNDG